MGMLNNPLLNEWFSVSATQRPAPCLASWQPQETTYGGPSGGRTVATAWHHATASSSAAFMAMEFGRQRVGVSEDAPCSLPSLLLVDELNAILEEGETAII